MSFFVYFLSLSFDLLNLSISCERQTFTFVAYSVSMGYRCNRFCFLLALFKWIFNFHIHSFRAFKIQSWNKCVRIHLTHFHKQYANDINYIPIHLYNQYCCHKAILFIFSLGAAWFFLLRVTTSSFQGMSVLSFL